MGKVYIPERLPAGVAVFYTTTDFDGYLNDRSVDMIRDFLMQRFGIDAALYTCHQVHGTEIVQVPGAECRVPSPSGPRHWNECDSCDALWSAAPGAALAIKVADCLPVTLVDARHLIIANIHSGWRGAAKRITAQTLNRLKSESRFDPAAAQAFLGPTLRSCCFEVGSEVIDEFQRAYGDVAGYVDPTRGERPYLDLVGLTIDLLEAFGIPRGSIHDSGLCTRCEGSDFHSYRRDRAKSGRNLAIVAQ